MSSREVRGRVVVNTRGFGFLELEPSHAGTTAFIAPPDLNPYLEGDLVAARLDEVDGRFSATQLRLLERTRDELFGSLVMHGRRPHLRVDRAVSNTDWPLELTPNDPLLALANQQPPVLLTAELRGNVLVPRRRIAAADAALERVVVRHGLHSEFPAAALLEAEQAQQPELGARSDLRTLPCVTIDAPSSRDLDDALAVLPAPDDGGLPVFVSIADVGAHEAVVRKDFDLAKRCQVSGIGQLVDIDNAVPRIGDELTADGRR